MGIGYRHAQIPSILTVCPNRSKSLTLCEQRRDAIGLHRGDDIGVMDLFAAERIVGEQAQEAFGHGGRLIRLLEVFLEIPHPLDHHVRVEGCAKVCDRVRVAMNSRST